MCGIAGIFNRKAGQQPNPQTLVNMAAIMHHRGPDGFGYHVMPNSGVGFSHARLSIIDLDEDRARQPFVNDSGNLLLAHNGEFYDFKRIRADLTARGARFRTKSDSEIGQFVFPKEVLLKHNIISSKQKEGKRGFRVYPPWDTPTSKQAQKTQNWQLQYLQYLQYNH